MSKNRAWNLEIYRGFDSEFSEDQLLLNQPIRDFLDNDDKFILVGAKGLGKTLFLRYKSYLYHNKYGENIKFNASQTELTENLRIHTNTFSKEDMLAFRDESIWKLIWELALWILIFRQFKFPINPRLEKTIESAEQFSTIVAQLLNKRSKIDQLRTYAREFQEQKSKVQSAVALFIDDVDQALHDLLLPFHPSDDYFEGTQKPSVEVWVSAQMGLVGAVYNLNRQNAHIKIYATIRREAYEAFDGSIKINYRQSVSILEYDKDEIGKIFEKNINLMDRKDWINPYGTTPVSRFVGFDEFPHKFAVDVNDQPRKEEVFNFIFRHTYGRPREIIMMGDTLRVLTASSKYKEADAKVRYSLLRATVNSVSNDLLQQYKSEIIPYLDETSLQGFVETVRSNVITKADFRLFDKTLLRNYFNWGLIGYVRPVNMDGSLKQHFLPVSLYNYRKHLVLPNTDYLLIHPTMDLPLLDHHTYGGFHNQYNIIGDGYDFFPRVDMPNYNADHYFPEAVTGNRWDAHNPGAGHNFPLNEIYKRFFDFENGVHWYERFQSRIKQAEQVLGILGRICYCHRLENQFDTGHFKEIKNKYIEELKNIHPERNYNANIPDSDSEASLEIFLEKLVGRHITLGCYLVIDMRIEWIHKLLTKGRFEFIKQDEKGRDSALAYLNRSFFIRGLTKNEPRDPENPAHRKSKQLIFAHLSAWEKERLRQFVETSTDEVKYLNWIHDPAHKEWLRINVLDNLWRPA
jgi:hypothetical protein